jgi:hypothetical protein
MVAVAVAGTVIVAVAGDGRGVGIVVGSVDVLPHPAKSQRVNTKPMSCGNRFLVFILLFLF